MLNLYLIACLYSIVTGLDGIKDPEKDAARKALNIRVATARFQEAIAAAERCPYPVIAAIHGVAYGLAIDIITACDVRYAAENARFSIKVSTTGVEYETSSTC